MPQSHGPRTGPSILRNRTELSDHAAARGIQSIAAPPALNADSLIFRLTPLSDSLVFKEDNF